MSKYEILRKVQDAQCVRVGAMADRETGLKYCVTCFTNRSVEPNDHALVFEHYTIKGLHNYYCPNCRKSIATVKPLSECYLCVRMCSQALAEKFKENHDEYIRENYCYSHYYNSIRFYNQ